MARREAGEKPKDFWVVLRRIFSYVSGMEFLIFIVVALCVIAPLCRIAGTALFQVITDNYLVPLSKNYDADLFVKFTHTICALAAIFALGAVSICGCGQIMAYISTKILFKIRTDAFLKMETLPIRYFDARKHGDIMSVYVNDMNNIREMLTSSATDFIFNIVMTVANIAMMLYYSWKLSIVIAFVIFVMANFIKKIVKKCGKTFREQQDELGKLNSFVEEMIDGQKIIKIFNREEKIESDFRILNEKLYDASRRANNYRNMLTPVLVNISNIGYSLVVMLGAIMVIRGNMTLGAAIAFFQYARGFTFPINEMSQGFNAVMGAAAGAERVFKLLDEEAEVDNGKIELTDARGDIDFENVAFGYENGKTILNNINMRAHMGQKIALAGSTGAGKTTIASLINRFYDIGAGKITFDGININDIKKDSLRKNVSIVLQDVNLFTETVLENIRYGRLDATDEEVKKAAELANADQFIGRLPNGYNTVLTDGGNDLSQGEKQLLSIARAILSNAPALILDEATSSIDTRTEKLIENGMNALMKGRTVFIIAHRLSTIRNSDAIIVIEGGQIIEKGTHMELLGNRGRYYQLASGLIEMG
ncbi:MAG: ABC transporter ATP-binding protein/permease [Rickettsiales bacterium]|jgi:ATP-binding cassette subfamily B protein|nr:ABC transporter ATP-binding protein/permease [Rickettsiales bacterium]